MKWMSITHITLAALLPFVFISDVMAAFTIPPACSSKPPAIPYVKGLTYDKCEVVSHKGRLYQCGDGDHVQGWCRQARYEPGVPNDDTWKNAWIDLGPVPSSPPPPPAPPLTPGAAVGTQVPIATEPLEVKNGAAPNVMLLIDDSASMVNEYLLVNVPASESNYALDIPSYSHVTPEPGIEVKGGVFPPDDKQFPDKGYWRFRSHHFNAIYYNPDIHYKPWTGLIPGSGTRQEYPRMVGGYARIHPNRPETTDLTQSTTFTGGFLNPCSGKYSYRGGTGTCDLIDVPTNNEVSRNYYIPHYYTWNREGNDDDRVDIDEKGERVDIVSGKTYKRESSRTDCRNHNACTYAEEIANFANWYTYYRTRRDTARAVVGMTLETLAGINIGIASIHAADINENTRTFDPDNPDERLPVKKVEDSPLEGHKLALLDQLYNMGTEGYTPLRQALYSTGRYFQCADGNLFNYGPSSPGSDTCPLETESNGGNCQQNFTIMLTDGFWVGGSDFCLGDYSGSQCADNSVENFDMNSTYGGTYKGYIFGDRFPKKASNGKSGGATLADVAMYFYGQDLHPSLSNDVPLTNRDRDTHYYPPDKNTMHQHMKTFTVGFGVGGHVVTLKDGEPKLPEPIVGDPPKRERGWPDPQAGDNFRLDDLIHAAYNSRAFYASAARPDLLMRELNRIFSNIAAVDGAGGAPAVNSSELTDESRIYRVSYDLAEASGSLQAFEVEADSGVLGENKIWSAADRLTHRDTVYTADATKDGKTSQQVKFSWPELNSEQRAAITQNQVEYIKGDQSMEGGGQPFRERKSLLGDIVNSSVVFIGPPSQTYDEEDPGNIYPPYATFKNKYKNRTAMLAVGANDGMLHLFDETSGNEIFSYIPSWLIQNNDDVKLERFTNRSYAHEYFVDLTPAAADAYVGSAWKTVLVGGMGLGGRGFFALDVTKAESSQNGSRLLWELDNEDDQGVGYSNGKPLIVPTNKSSGGEQMWAAIFANGFNSNTGEVSLFVVPLTQNLGSTLDKGTDYQKITASIVTGSTAMHLTKKGEKNGLGAITGYDSDGNGTVDYVYGGDLDGQLWRFDLSKANWDEWRATRIFTAEYGLSKVRQPLVNPPLAIAHPDPSVNDPAVDKKDPIVVVGSGTWFKTGDSSDTSSTHSIYAIRDNLSGIRKVRLSNLQEREWPIFDDPEFGMVRYFEEPNSPHCSGGDDPFCIDYSKSDGWYVNLKGIGGSITGERAARNFTHYNNLVSGATVIPKDTLSCGESIPGAFLRFSLVTGGLDPRFESQLDVNSDGVFNSKDNSSKGPIAAIVLKKALSKFNQLGNFTVASQGNELFSMANPGVGSDPIKPGRLSWRELGIDGDNN